MGSESKFSEATVVTWRRRPGERNERLECPRLLVYLLLDHIFFVGGPQISQCAEHFFNWDRCPLNGHHAANLPTYTTAAWRTFFFLFILPVYTCVYLSSLYFLRIFIPKRIIEFSLPGNHVSLFFCLSLFFLLRENLSYQKTYNRLLILLIASQTLAKMILRVICHGLQFMPCTANH